MKSPVERTKLWTVPDEGVYAPADVVLVVLTRLTRPAVA